MQPGFRLFFYLAGGVSMKLRATDGSSVALFHFTLEFKYKIKTVGVARQQFHFLCSDKENEAKENLTVRFIYIGNYVLDFYIGCAGHVWVEVAATSIQANPSG